MVLEVGMEVSALVVVVLTKTGRDVTPEVRVEVKERIGSAVPVVKMVGSDDVGSIYVLVVGIVEPLIDVLSVGRAEEEDSTGSLVPVVATEPSDEGATVGNEELGRPVIDVEGLPGSVSEIGS